MVSKILIMDVTFYITIWRPKINYMLLWNCIDTWHENKKKRLHTSLNSICEFRWFWNLFDLENCAIYVTFAAVIRVLTFALWIIIEIKIDILLFFFGLLCFDAILRNEWPTNRHQPGGSFMNNLFNILRQQRGNHQWTKENTLSELEAIVMALRWLITRSCLCVCFAKFHKFNGILRFIMGLVSHHTIARVLPYTFSIIFRGTWLHFMLSNWI